MEALSTTEKTPLIRQPDNSLAIPTLTSADKELNEKAGEEEDTSKEDLSHRAIWRRALLHAIFYFFSYLLYFRLVAYVFSLEGLLFLTITMWSGHSCS